MDLVQAEAWRAYRRAFENFSRIARRVQSLPAETPLDHAATQTDLIELEKARVEYDRRRDDVAEYFLPAALRRNDARNTPEDHESRVKPIAELIWESAGRPDGTADLDWRRAEEIVQEAEEADLAQFTGSR